MISKVYGPVFCLILSVLLLAIVPQSHARQPSVPPQEGDTLDNITISEDEARNIIKGLFDLPRLTHSLALGRIAKDERLTAFTDGFMQRNNIQVLTIGYIDSDEFWPRIFKQQRLGKINKADADNPLAAKIIFVPASTEGPPTGYTTRLELTGKTSQVYELLSISQAEVDSIAASTSQQQLGNTTFATPNEAKETVLSALIAALQRVELKASPQDAVALVTFQAAPPDDTGLPTYGFDQMVYEQLGADYPTATIAGQTVRTAWKSLKSNAPDKVIAVAGGNASPVFEMNGVALTATPGNANTYKVSLMGTSDGTTSEVLALTSADNGLTMGLLNTISYDEEIINVKIVPINGAGTNFNLLSLQQKLNTIYQPAVASWQVQVLASVTLPDTWNDTVEGLADAETGMLSNYTAEMNDLIKAYLQEHERDKDAYYVFLVNKAETTGKKGYMPRKKQWGFAFTDVHGTSDDALAKTIAHELGHGVFRLEHTFSEKGLPQSQTTNLMDYTPIGTALYKYQWDYVHDPVNVVTLFDDVGERAMNNGSFLLANFYEYLKKIREANKEEKDEISMTIATGLWEYDKITLGNKGFSYIKMMTRGFNPFQLSNSVADSKADSELSSELSERPKYSIMPAELTKSTYIKDGVNYTKYKFHELQESGNVSPYVQANEATGVSRIEIDVKSEEVFDFEEYLFPTRDIFLEHVNWVSQFDESVFGLCSGCWRTSCCRRAVEYMMGNTSIANCTDSVIAVTLLL
ncbi:MAG: hypothetical protein RIE86_00440, partial [Imperialibacter sp.]|uniref:hypothetical protein n=1 Tax=Imperialibacter sp. TaxID=2038411 RepID=UPI0032EBAAF9